MRAVALSLLIATSAAAQSAPSAGDSAGSADFAVVLIERAGPSEYKIVPQWSRWKARASGVRYPVHCLSI